MEILTPEDKEAIRKALEDAKALRAEIAKAKRAGIDVADLERELAEAEARLRSIERVYIRGA